MYFKAGDILVCSNNRTNTTGYNVIPGEQYVVIDDWTNEVKVGAYRAISVKDKNGKKHSFIPEILFITLEAYRHFKINIVME